MNAYLVVHLILAGVCGVLFFVHAALWIHARDRAQLWVSLCLLLYVPFLLEAAGGARYSGGLLGRPLLWLVVGLPSPMLAACILNAVWQVLGIPVRETRRAIVLVGLALGLVMVSLNALTLAQALLQRQPVWFEDLHNRQSWAELPLSLYEMLICACLIYDFYGVRRTKRELARAGFMLIPTVIALSLYQVLWSLQVIQGPFLITLTGFPFVVFASTAMVSQYLKAVAAMKVRSEDLGDYRLVKKLAAGGMGELFLAVRTGPAGFSRPVALKRTREEEKRDGQWTTRFLAEARLAATLQHPNIVAVYDLGRLPDGWFMVMEYLVGLSLAELKARLAESSRSLPPELVLWVGEQVCRGLAHAHARGVVHRDVSPQNVMVTFDGEVKIVDFGIAKVLSEHEAALSGAFPAGAPAGSTQLTLPGHMMGKKGYFSPEMLAGRAASPASDQFALGVVLHELLVGIRPSDGAVEGFARPRLRELRGNLPEPATAAIERSLASRPEERFPSAEAMGAELRRALRSFPAPDLSGWLKEWLGDLWRARSAEVETAKSQPESLAPPTALPQAIRRI